jgi:hypothetical protein
VSRRRAAHFSVDGGPFGKPKERKATVTIEAGMFRVRPLRRRRTYDLTLADVARFVYERVCRAELAEEKRAKAAERAARRGR